ncbi:TetR/AcrR family transcriptional regulator [Kocuria tytonis]|uniref:TetR family transcriptional regulator n=1 Tax=Kocuria tytonis TaxID=2054280 RepID=A0A495A1P2_9MICC|nr:TetR family transcriptional regulator [Kocuria tytonis]RKQ33394.1 TetR family transcriptional regulator [Kocuria tytonis]
MSLRTSSTPRGSLTRDRVLEAAIALVDRGGAQALTMRRLASELNVEAMSLYNHVENKQDILDGMAGLLIARMRPWGDEVLTWKEALRTVCVTYRATITAHPHVFAGQGGRPLVTGEDHAAYQYLMTMLRDAGFDEPTAADLFQAGSKLTRGFALSDIANPAGPIASTAWDPDRAFNRALTILIDGFEATLATP